MTPRFSTIPVLAACIAMAGCDKTQPHPDNHAAVNQSMVRMLNRSAIDEAIISQHTLYPYHFVRHDATLNELGQRDLDVLLSHFLTYPHASRPLNVRQGRTSDELYERRVGRVLQIIKDAGLDAETVEPADDHPGGEGAASGRVIRIMERSRDGMSLDGNASGPTSGEASQ